MGPGLRRGDGWGMVCGVVAVALAANAAPALAQDTQDEPSAADILLGAPAPPQDDSAADAQEPCANCPIVIRGAPLDAPVGDAAYSITLFSAASIEAEASGRVENLLRQVPGLTQFRHSDARSANPTSQGVTLRGLGGNASSRALLLLDGVPQADPFGGWVSFPGYDAVPLGSVRVRRGGGSGSEGPGALAGTIELDSAAVNRGRVEGEFFYGSRDSLEGSALVQQQLGEGSLSLSGQYARGDGFIPIVESQRGAVDWPADYEQAGVAARLVAPAGEISELQANLRAFTDERERGFAFSDNENRGADASLRFVSRGRWAWSALAYVQVREFETSFGSVAADRNSVTQVLDQFQVPSTGLGARFELRPPVGPDAELRVGGDWRRTTGRTRENFFFTAGEPQRNREAGGETETYGAFVEGSWRLSPVLLLTGGGRIDRWTISDGFRREIELVSPVPGAVRSNDVFPDRDGWEGTGRLGFAWNAGSLFTVRGAGYLGWRLPTLNELYRPFRVGADATAANELLAPERLSGVELGFDYEIYTARLSATVFYNELDDAIANVTLARGPGNFPGVGFVSAAGSFSQRQNLDAVEALGVEVDFAVDVGAIGVKAAYAYVDSTVRAAAGQPGIEGLRPAQVPDHVASATIGWYPSSGDFSLSASARYVASQFEDDLNVLALDDAFTLDGFAEIAITDDLRLKGRVENLFDARIEAAISGAGEIERARPRTFWLGLQVDLQ